MDINASGSIAVNLQQNLITIIIPILTLIVTLLAVYLGYFLQYQAQHHQERKEAYVKFLNSLDRLHMKLGDTTQNLEAHLESISRIRLVGSPDAASKMEQIISEEIPNTGEENIDYDQITKRFYTELIPIMRSDLDMKWFKNLRSKLAKVMHWRQR